MKYLFLFLFFKLGVYNSINAQFVFDYSLHFDSISKLSQSKKSEYNYNKLIKRFNNLDSTLTSKEILFMMIGETQKKSYSPYELIEDERDLIELVNQKKYDEGLTKCNELLNKSPLNFTALMQKAFILSIIQTDKTEKEIAYFKFIRVLDAILLSGDGTLYRPIFILSPFDGQIITQLVFSLKTGKMISFEDSNGLFLDQIEIISENNNDPNVYMYFLIDHAVSNMFNQDILKKFEKHLKKE